MFGKLNNYNLPKKLENKLKFVVKVKKVQLKTIVPDIHQGALFIRKLRSVLSEHT